MGRQSYSLASFNRGIVSRLGLARTDVKRIAFAAEEQENVMPRVLGAAALRAGWAYIVNPYLNAAARLLKFIFATNDTALLELSDSIARVIINDVVLTRPAVTSAVTNGNFTTDIVGWTDMDEAGATSQWVAPGYMQLAGDGTARAIREQQVTVAGANIGVEHALRIVVARGPLYVRVGSTSGGDQYVGEAALGTGTHSLSFTPTGDFFIRFFSSLIRVTWVDSCNLEAAGVVTLPTPWVSTDLSNVRAEQSADVLFLACSGRQQRRIERRGTRPNARSWSIVLYQPEDGPFKVRNVTTTTLTPSALTGNITVAASKPLFKSTQVGGLFSVFSQGQVVTTAASASGVSTASIRVIGTGTTRFFAVIISGDASGSTVDLQRSFDNSTWASLGPPFQWTADVSGTINDELSNQIVYYRLMLTTRVAPDTVTMTLAITTGSLRGIFRITDFINSQSVGAEVLSALGNTSASDSWQEGQWSDKNGFPTAVRLQEGRLWWVGQNNTWGSVSDTFDSFDDQVVGDSGPINRTIGAGPVDTINWILALQRLMLGAQGAEFSVRSSSFDEPITPTNFHVKAPSTQGSANVDAVQIDQQGYFVDRSRRRIYELQFDIKAYDYTSVDATVLCPDLANPGVVRMDAQRKPDTRLHCVRSDGTALVLIVDRAEDVMCWIDVTTDGLIEDVCVLPALDGDSDDQVYYVVKRTINGATVRFIEKWAQEEDCIGGTISKLADAHVVFQLGAPTTTFTLAHLPSTEVVVWADGADVGTDDTTDPANWTQRYTTDGAGQVVLAAAASNVVIGLGYSGRFKSTKLGVATNDVPTPLSRHKNVRHLGLIMTDVHKKGVRFGADFDHLDNMPEIESGTTVATEVRTDYDEEPLVFPGTWTTDSRMCLLMAAPRPATLLAATFDLSVNA